MPTIYSGRAAHPDASAHSEPTTTGLSRRALLRGTAATSLGALLVVSGRAVLCQARPGVLRPNLSSRRPWPPTSRWRVTPIPTTASPTATTPSLSRTTTRRRRKNESHRNLIKGGIADLDQRAGSGGYRGLRWEDDRVTLLRPIEDTAFFQAVRGGLVVSLYNQKEIWPLFGYESEFYSKGGYINRGFDDIDWL